MAKRQEWATEGNAPQVEKPLHISNTRDRGYGRKDWFMFAPPYSKQRSGIVCGQCKTEILDGKKHCPHCWGEEE